MPYTVWRGAGIAWYGPGYTLPAPGYTPARYMPAEYSADYSAVHAAWSPRGALGSRLQLALGRNTSEVNSRSYVFGPPIRQDYGEMARREVTQDWIRAKGISKQGLCEAL